MLVVVEMRDNNPAFWEVYGLFEGEKAQQRAYDFIASRRGQGFVHSVSEVIPTTEGQEIAELLRSHPEISAEDLV